MSSSPILTLLKLNVDIKLADVFHSGLNRFDFKISPKRGWLYRSKYLPSLKKRNILRTLVESSILSVSADNTKTRPFHNVINKCLFLDQSHLNKIDDSRAIISAVSWLWLPKARNSIASVST